MFYFLPVFGSGRLWSLDRLLVSLIEPSLIHLSADAIYELLVGSCINKFVYVHRTLSLRNKSVSVLFLHKCRVDSVYSGTQVALRSHNIILR